MKILNSFDTVWWSFVVVSVYLPCLLIQFILTLVAKICLTIADKFSEVADAVDEHLTSKQ